MQSKHPQSQIFKKQLQDRIKTGAPVTEVYLVGSFSSISNCPRLNPAVIHPRKVRTHEDGKGMTITTANGKLERYDAVVMATQPDDAAKALGPESPDWLNQITTEV